MKQQKKNKTIENQFKQVEWKLDVGAVPNATMSSVLQSQRKVTWTVNVFWDRAICVRGTRIHLDDGDVREMQTRQLQRSVDMPSNNNSKSSVEQVLSRTNVFTPFILCRHQTDCGPGFMSMVGASLELNGFDDLLTFGQSAKTKGILLFDRHRT